MHSSVHKTTYTLQERKKAFNCGNNDGETHQNTFLHKDEGSKVRDKGAGSNQRGVFLQNGNIHKERQHRKNKDR